MQRSPGVEVFLDHGQQVGVGAIFPGASRLGDERVRECVVRRHAGVGVDGQAALDEFARGKRDAAPVFERSEAVIGDKDGLHFFEVRISVEGSVSAEKKVGNDADRPDIAKRRAREFSFGGVSLGSLEKCLHWLAMTSLFEYFWGHVAWSAAGCGEDVESLFVHDSR